MTRLMTPREGFKKRLARANRHVIASFIMKMIGLLTLILAIMLKEWGWVIFTVFFLIAGLIPVILKRDAIAVLPWQVEFLLAFILFWNIIGELLGGYYDIPGINLVMQVALTVFVAFFALAFIYILDQAWDGLQMDTLAMAYVTVVTAITGAVFIEIANQLGFFGKYQTTAEGVLFDLIVSVVAVSFFAVLGVKWIEKGRMDEMTDGMAKIFKEKVMERGKKKETGEIEQEEEPGE